MTGRRLTMRSQIASALGRRKSTAPAARSAPALSGREAALLAVVFERDFPCLPCADGHFLFDAHVAFLAGQFSGPPGIAAIS